MMPPIDLPASRHYPDAERLVGSLKWITPGHFTYSRGERGYVLVPSAEGRPREVEYQDAGIAGYCARTALLDARTGVELRERGHYPGILDDDYIFKMFLAALLRNAGKNKIPRDLHERPSLSRREKREILKHAEYSASMAGELFPEELFPGYGKVADFIRYHHECKKSGRISETDGDGAPLASHILRMGGRFDSLVTPRPYMRKTLTPGEAIPEMERICKKSPPHLLETFGGLVLSNDPSYREFMRGIYRGTEAEKYFADI